MVRSMAKRMRIGKSELLTYAEDRGGCTNALKIAEELFQRLCNKKKILSSQQRETDADGKKLTQLKWERIIVGCSRTLNWARVPRLYTQRLFGPWRKAPEFAILRDCTINFMLHQEDTLPHPTIQVHTLSDACGR